MLAIWVTIVCVIYMGYHCVCHKKSVSMRCVSAREASWRQGFDPYAPLGLICTIIYKTSILD